MTKRQVRKVLGRWRTTGMNLWEAGYLDILGPAHFRLGRDGGHIAFGPISSRMAH
ncbi:hypothetical protein [Limobrevibacterium gyesilva]|uniref:Uncharacterized protein n=1 Tax=Limobrevibacterium gyesilva TaxID=2991712 RepID=A0AA41YK30_9PROT|nr:hypothetical protein [Limobrevibacterium gyesilva]MCW3474699.1 hypothetical protein [Limobrevibacterium gyesilva]